MIFAALLFAFIAAGAYAAVNLLLLQGGYAAAQKEYDALRQYAPRATLVSARDTESEENPLTMPKPDLSAINPDYIGWLRVEGTGIDYPVVRGRDNRKYLSTTFSGKKNPSGAIFMDAACAEGFEAPFAVLYGHNMKDGTMFAELKRYLEDGYLDEHSRINRLLFSRRSRYPFGLVLRRRVS